MHEDFEEVLEEQEPIELPPAPTTAPAGSNEKILVMAERYSLGYELHHPGDPRGVNPIPETRRIEPSEPKVYGFLGWRWTREV